MCAEVVKGTVEWNGRRITVEGPPEFVSAELGRFRGGTEETLSPESGAATGRPMNDASFVTLKNPKDHYEKIAVLAVRLKEAGKTEFDDAEMRRAYLRAGIKPPKVMTQALVDTKRFRDFIEPTATRGQYRLTDHGADFVRFELPRKAGSNK
ncbi:MAG TPA: hypothetical protein VHX13_07495 [Acidobacteriaceae bacterium]|jgi:hypothetical protein|nr:hypothetical protein [Acidobacteriaceae bacterium]